MVEPLYYDVSFWKVMRQIGFWYNCYMEALLYQYFKLLIYTVRPLELHRLGESELYAGQEVIQIEKLIGL